MQMKKQQYSKRAIENKYLQENRGQAQAAGYRRDSSSGSTEERRTQGDFRSTG